MGNVFFNRIACSVSKASGSLSAFVAALGVVIVWAGSGPLFRFNNTWQNADTAAIHIKLDELIRVTHNANDELLNLEQMDQDRLEEIRLRYEQLAKTAAHLKAKKDRCMPGACDEETEEPAGV